MDTWKIYYEEYQRRQTLLDEARQYRLINAFLKIKESRVKKSPIRIQPGHYAANKVMEMGSK